MGISYYFTSMKYPLQKWKSIFQDVHHNINETNYLKLKTRYYHSTVINVVTFDAVKTKSTLLLNAKISSDNSLTNS